MHWFWRAVITVMVATLFSFPLMVVALAAGMLDDIRRPVYEILLFWYGVVIIPIQLITIWVSTTWEQRWDGETRCRKCGYILRGISEPRCPECGERI